LTIFDPLSPSSRVLLLRPKYCSHKTKRKISNKIKDIINSPDFDKSVFINHSKENKKQGYHKGFYCRSSYEKQFVDFCDQFNIKLKSAENNNFSVNYESVNGKIKTYFPDFYLKDFDLVVEIKPNSMYDFGDNPLKFHEAKKKYRFIVLTEEDELMNQSGWNNLYEYICTI
jgi:hypothetical protein